MGSTVVEIPNTLELMELSSDEEPEEDLRWRSLI